MAAAIRWALLVGAGISVALVVQLRKYEKGNDSLLNESFLILALTSVVCVFLFWAGWSQILQYFFNSDPQRARKRALIPIGCMVALILYRYVGFVSIEMKFKAVFLSVGFFAFTAASVDLAAGWRGVGKVTLGRGIIILFFLTAAFATAIGGNFLHNIERSLPKTITSANLAAKLEHVTRGHDIRPAFLMSTDLKMEFNAKLNGQSHLVFSLTPQEGKEIEKGWLINVQVETVNEKRDFMLDLDSASKESNGNWKDFIIDLKGQDGYQKAHLTLEAVRKRSTKKQSAKDSLIKLQLFTPAWNWKKEDFSTGLAYITLPQINNGIVPKKDFNILLISLDTLRSDRLNFYGYHRETAPNLAQLAEEGIVFTNVFAPATWTLPSHMSLFTSLYPAAHGICDGKKEVTELNFQTLPQLIKTGGYYNAAFTGAGYVGSTFGFHNGFDTFRENSKVDPQAAYGIDREVQNAIQWIEGHKDLRFFLFFHTYEIHDYVRVMPEHSQFYATGYNGRLQNNFGALLHPRHREEREAFGILPEDVEFMANLYDGAIRHTDEHLGYLFQALRDMDLYDDTMIIVFSDHGESFGEEHDNGKSIAWAHGSNPYESVMRVPLIIKMPKGSTVHSKTIDGYYSLVDMMPSLADMLKLKPRGRIQGVSWMPAIAGGSAPAADRPLFSQPRCQAETLIGVRHDGFKYIQRKGEYELYDLRLDPAESFNLAGQEVFAGKLEQFSTIVNRHVGDSEKYDWRHGPEENIPNAVKAELEALGYLQ